MPIVVIAGVPSVGKSTLLGELKGQIESHVVNTGSMLFDLAKERGLVAQRDELRALPPQTLAGLRVEVAANVPTEGLVLVDSHLTVKGRAGLVCVLSAGVLERMPVKAIVLIEADPEAIVERRQRDQTRRRDADDVEATRAHQEHNRAAAWAIAATREIAVIIIRNDEPKEAAKRLAALLRELPP